MTERKLGNTICFYCERPFNEDESGITILEDNFSNFDNKPVKFHNECFREFSPHDGKCHC